jgi:hypothetical protein
MDINELLTALKSQRHDAAPLDGRHLVDFLTALTAKVAERTEGHWALRRGAIRFFPGARRQRQCPLSFLANRPTRSFVAVGEAFGLSKEDAFAIARAADHHGNELPPHVRAIRNHLLAATGLDRQERN